MSDVDKYLVPKESYKADIELLEKYVGFSSELLRISLLAMGGYGALITALYGNPKELCHLQHAYILFASMLIFACSAGATLFHRYYASDSLSWQIAFIRAHAKNNDEIVKAEHKGWIDQLKKAHKWLIASEWIFGAAVICFIIGLGQYLF